MVKKTPKASKDDYIMVVEDDNLLLRVILEKLISSGFTTEGFARGTEALRYIEDYEKIPSLIWLDYYLMDTNGLVFTKIVREKLELLDLPIVVVSARPLSEYRRDLEKLGVAECIDKGLHTLDEIVDRIRTIVE